MLVAALMLALAAAPRDGLPAGAADPIAGRCHMGECEWFAELARETVRRSRVGRLVGLRLVAGRSSVAQGDDYSEAWGPDARVEWQPEPYESWIFCSERTPAVIGRAGTGYVADLLVGPPPPPLEMAHRLYARVCGEEPRHSARDPAAEEQSPMEIELARPEDVFSLRWTVSIDRTNGARQVAPRRRSR